MLTQARCYGVISLPLPTFFKHIMGRSTFNASIQSKLSTTDYNLPFFLVCYHLVLSSRSILVVGSATCMLKDACKVKNNAVSCYNKLFISTSGTVCYHHHREPNLRQTFFFKWQRLVPCAFGADLSHAQPAMNSSSPWSPVFCEGRIAPQN